MTSKAKLSAAEYAAKRATIDAAQRMTEKMWPEWRKGGVVPAELCATAEYKAATNEVRGEVEQYELLRDLPETIVAYVGKGKGNGMGCDRVLGQTYPVTVWTGLELGNATKGASWRVNSYMGTHMHQFYARIGGREYTGRSMGEGMCIVLRETAQSKRDNPREEV